MVSSRHMLSHWQNCQRVTGSALPTDDVSLLFHAQARRKLSLSSVTFARFRPQTSYVLLLGASAIRQLMAGPDAGGGPPSVLLLAVWRSPPSHRPLHGLRPDNSPDGIRAALRGTCLLPGVPVTVTWVTARSSAATLCFAANPKPLPESWPGMGTLADIRPKSSQEHVSIPAQVERRKHMRA